MQNHLPTESFNGQIRLFGKFESNALRGDTHSWANTPNYTNTHDLMEPIKIQLSPPTREFNGHTYDRVSYVVWIREVYDDNVDVVDDNAI